MAKKFPSLNIECRIFLPLLNWASKYQLEGRIFHAFDPPPQKFFLQTYLENELPSLSAKNLLPLYHREPGYQERSDKDPRRVWSLVLE